jgi:hypothetical protein
MLAGAFPAQRGRGQLGHQKVSLPRAKGRRGRGYPLDAVQQALGWPGDYGGYGGHVMAFGSARVHFSASVTFYMRGIEKVLRIETAAALDEADLCEAGDERPGGDRIDCDHSS